MFVYFLLLVYVSLIALGQLFFKLLSSHFHPNSIIFSVRDLSSSPLFYLSIILYALASLLWIYLLSFRPLSYFYPLAVSLSLVSTVFIGIFYFKESLSFRSLLGLLLIIIGISMCSYNPR